MENVTDRMVVLVTDYGLGVIGAILILIVGRILAGLGRRTARRLMTRARVDPTIRTFVGNLVHYLVLAVAVVAALKKFGIETASLVAVLGAAGFAVGLALQGSLSNFAAGVMILVFRPFRVGDSVKAAGISGTVKEVRLFTTVLATPDNVKMIVPNSKVFGSTITNYSEYETRRLDLNVGFAYDTSIQKAKALLEGLVEAESRVLSAPAPLVAAQEFTGSSVNLLVRIWVRRTDYGLVRLDLARAIKETLDAHGIATQRVVPVAGAAGMAT
ncbi:MAG: mechanosensitive ion channel family protein [Candidatus Krumholzibacteriia bacterium]